MRGRVVRQLQPAVDHKRTGRNLELNLIDGEKRAMTDTIWRCDQVRAGQLYNRMIFDTKAEAEQFMQRMQQMEPDHMISIEAIDASQIWN
jgi:hypothetical protein